MSNTNIVELCSVNDVEYTVDVYKNRGYDLMSTTVNMVDGKQEVTLEFRKPI